MLKVHGHAASINVRKILWLCAELGLQFQLRERGTVSHPVNDPAFHKLNPFGLTPVIEDDGFVLAESNTILRYLARREGRYDLLPGDARDAAKVDMWIDWQATDFNDSWRYAFTARFRYKPGYDDPDQISQSLTSFDAKAAIIESQLAHTDAFIAGTTFTLADVPIGLSVRRWLATSQNADSYPRISTYYQNLCKRPAFSTFGGPDSPP